MNLTILMDGLSFPEGPRWHKGYLYFSDFHQHVVRRLGVEGSVKVVAQVPNQPSGLGWLPDGRMLVVSMMDRKVLVQDEAGELHEYADLGAIANGDCNDMVVDKKGRAYVGNFGADKVGWELDVRAPLALIDTDGSVSVAAENLQFPNGAVITPDGKTMIIAETMGRRLTAFDIDDLGVLHNRRLWANIEEPYAPDGICLDADGGVWLAGIDNAALRVEEGGRISDKVEAEQGVFACTLGGKEGRTLFLCTAGSLGQIAVGRIEMVQVGIPAADW